MTLHVVGLPHTLLDEAVPTCAYTAKVAKFRRMDVGRDVIVYGTEGADVVLLNESERSALFGPDDPGRLPFWPDEEQCRLFNARAVAQITERADAGDLVLLVGGYQQRLIQQALPHLTVIEPFVGYEGITTSFCAFESHAWRHHVYGMKQIKNGRWLDAVIPNYFDPADFMATQRSILTAGMPEYLLFVGRVIGRKGIELAIEIAKSAGLGLIVAGPGATATDDGMICEEKIQTMWQGDTHELAGLRYVGPVGVAERASLMMGARALLAPTIYIEPFGGVAVEAMMCGTPVIASDFGAFPETVENGVDGYRFRSLAAGVAAVDKVDDLDRDVIRERAVARYSLDAVAPLFDAWFTELETVIAHGWYTADVRG